MCGICGKFALEADGRVDEKLIRDMAALIAHRGPDDEGFHIDGRIGLGQRRLSIVDLSGGHQPMTNEDGAVWIVFNGEIYNHSELRPDLEARGHRYSTRSDTETILHAYEEYGTDCVARLRGMFAFAIWDSRRQCLFAARDRFGIKPFYYWHNARGFVFASEMKSILREPEVDTAFDPIALYDYFTFKFIPGPRTPFRAIHRLQPAHWLRVQDGAVEVKRYWQPDYRGLSAGSEAEHLEQLESLLSEAIRDHLMSEVPQGVFLSGGVDSSLLTLQMSALLDEPVRTFSIGFEGHGGFDERLYADDVARACATRHHAYDCPPASVDMLPDILWHIEEPLADAAMLPLYTLCHQANKEVKVVHCGDGGDEGFGGYSRFYWDRYAALYGRVPAAIRQGLLEPLFRAGQQLPWALKELSRRAEKYTRFAALPPPARYTNWFTLIADDIKHQLLHPDFLREVGMHRSTEVFESLFSDADALGLDALGRNQYCDLHSFIPDDLMLKADKIAMSAGLEGRFPFLDHRLIEFGLSLPDHHKIRGKQMKLPLKKLLARYMPKDFVYRGKQGFEVPISTWFKRDLDQTLRDTIQACKTGGDTILNVTYLEQMVQRLHAGDPVVGRQLFVVFVFQRWRDLFEHPRQLIQERLRTTPSA